MINTHLNILHLAPKTDNEKVNEVAKERYKNLMVELDTQKITDYTIREGFYDPINTKQAIHKGHRLIVELAKQQGLSNVVIMEDDVAFSSAMAYDYFISQIPESYDIFSGLVYCASMEGSRVKNGASGIMSLYSLNSRHFDFFLSMNIDNHIDREAGLTAYKHEYYVCSPMVVVQRGGWSYNLKQSLYYDDYLVGKELFVLR